MPKDLGLSVVAGLASALVFLSVLTGGGLAAALAYLIPLPILLIGLGRGTRGALVGGGIGLATVAAAAPTSVSVFVLVALVPPAVLLVLAFWRRQEPSGERVWLSPGTILGWVSVVAVGLMVLGTIVVAAPGTGLEEQAQALVAKALDQLASDAAPDLREAAGKLWSAFFPAMLGSAWWLMTVANGTLAQWIVIKAGHELRPPPAYGDLELPLWLAAALAVTVLAGAVDRGNVGYLARNAAVLLLWPQLFAGLAFVHSVARRRAQPGLALVVFYVVFFVTFGWSFIAVAGLGLVRHWTRLRRRHAGRGQEEK
jgi:hypothetical protein